MSTVGEMVDEAAMILAVQVRHVSNVYNFK